MEIDIANLGKKLNAKSKDEINKAIEKAKNITHVKYTSKYYIKGIFNKSYSFFKNLKKKPEVYHFLTNNCLHVASRALYKGKCTGTNAEYYSTALFLLTSMTIPNNANVAFDFFRNNFEAYYSAPWWQRFFMTDPYQFFYDLK